MWHTVFCRLEKVIYFALHCLIYHHKEMAHACFLDKPKKKKEITKDHNHNHNHNQNNPPSCYRLCPVVNSDGKWQIFIIWIAWIKKVGGHSQPQQRRVSRMLCNMQWINFIFALTLTTLGSILKTRPCTSCINTLGINPPTHARSNANESSENEPIQWIYRP